MAAHADPIVTVEDIDEALWWVVLTAPRDANYPRILDALLDQRNYLSADPASPDANPQGLSHRHEDRQGADPTGSHPSNSP